MTWQRGNRGDFVVDQPWYRRSGMPPISLWVAGVLLGLWIVWMIGL